MFIEDPLKACVAGSQFLVALFVHTEEVPETSNLWIVDNSLLRFRPCCCVLLEEIYDAVDDVTAELI